MVNSAANPSVADSAPSSADLSPLAWVLDETRRSLQGVGKALKRFAHDAQSARGVDLEAVDATPLRLTRQHLHQVGGALEMVGQGVAARMVRAMEGAVQRFVAEPETCTLEAAQLMETAGFALQEYVEDQLRPAPRPALGLFPQYQQVQELAGGTRAHPADLWEFAWSWRQPELPQAPERLHHSPELRKRLDQAVLRIMKHDDRDAAGELSVIGHGLAAGTDDAQQAGFWAVAAAFFETLARGQLPLDRYTKGTSSRTLLQYASLARGDGRVSERLALDLLFHCAQAAGGDPAQQGPLLSAVQASWQLHPLIDYTQAMFGLYDPASLAQARRRVEQAKESWSALAGGELGRLKGCVDQFGLVGESLQTLYPQGEPLVQALQRLMGRILQSRRVPTAELGIEVATAVLFLEASLADFRPEDEAFGQRAQELAERLDRADEGGGAAPLAPWMEELYRHVSDRQTMGTVVGELRVTLDELEQKLDRFARLPDDPSVLEPVPALMAQMRGVLSVLGLDQASLAVGHMSEQVEQLMQQAGSLDPQALGARFDKLGNSLGALGFLLDTLGYQPTLARQLFFYDEQTQEFRFVGGRRAADPGAQPAPDAGARPEPAAAPEPVSAPEQMLELDRLQPEPDVVQATAEEASVTSEEELEDDAELLDIFLAEAREVVTDGAQAIEALDETPADEESLTTLRRAFHTLKGSSRMVGLSEYGEAAWALEQLLNAWLAEHRPANEDLCVVSGQALQALGQWADDLARGQEAGWRADPFQTLADGLRVDGRRLPLELHPVPAGEPAAPLPAPEPEPQPVDASLALDLEGLELPDLELPAPQEPEQAEALEPDAGSVSELPELPELSEDELASVVEALGARPVAGIEPRPEADAETEETAASIAAALEDFELDLELPLDEEPLADDADALAGDAPEAEPAPVLPDPVLEAQDPASVGEETLLPELFELSEAPAAEVEELPDDGEPEEVPEPEAEIEVEPEPEPEPVSVEPAVQVVGDLRISKALYEVFLSEADAWSAQLQSDLQAWAAEPADAVPERAVARAHSLGGSAATVGFAGLSEMARAVEHALLRLEGQDHGTAEQAGLLCEAADEIRNVLHRFAAGALKSPSPRLLQAVQELEPTPPSAPTLQHELQVPDESPVPAPVAPAAATPLAAEPQLTALAPLLEEGAGVQDVIDPDLFPIFEEEGEELLPELSAALRRWVARPEALDARAQALRVLHTLKGSARLAGALRMGELAHQTESAIEVLGSEVPTEADLEPLLEALDSIEADFQRLRAVGADRTWVPEPAPSAVEPVPSDASAPQAAPEARPEAAAVEHSQVADPVALSLVSARASARQMVRVRTQLLDRLLAQAGELMTGRARMEADIARLRNSLAELGGNVERLRGQLRDVELQAETQMQSRLAQSRDAQQGFDPLEFDRFTRMQELTRMMAESVNDVATVQRALQRVVESSEDELAAQGRQSRSLQDDLLRTRMMEFDGIAERLYRVVRQASKETDKPVRLDILGGGIEIDRGILNRMTPVFEHLLRNGVVHGIESAQERETRGKEAAGHITVELEQQGNDVAVEFRDDGGGLNLDRIREQAVQRGLLGPDEALDEERAGQLILSPGFTTASDLTGLAGRGVGMDVVRSEIQSLGGRIEIRSEAGQGCAFRLVLPLTTAVTQVVLLRIGELVIGVPANLVDIVVRSNENELEQAYAEQAFVHEEQSLPFFWAGALLQHSARSGETGARIRPVVVLRSADQRVALHVDEVLGSQEVVVKALGPQLSRLPGLVAVTALASGAVTLIYNPVALATVYGEQALALAAAPAEDRVRLSAESDIPLVLVVDDSITVRRVTQRMLQREGYRVALAADGLAGLAEIAKERPALVLSDIEMPRMDGFEFLRNLRADEELAGLPVVMITSRTAEKHREHARELGANHYLGKPYSEDELLSLVQSHTRAAAAQPVA